MSMREWNEVIYGVELPNTAPTNESILNFIYNHKDVFSDFFTDEYIYTDESGTNIEDIDAFVNGYEDNFGNFGIEAMIADTIDDPMIVATSGDDGFAYIGMFAVRMFPWEKFEGIDMWKSLTPEYIESVIKPIIEELYGTCPEFDAHDVWYFG